MAIDEQLREFGARTKQTEKPEYIKFKLAGETLHALPEAPAGVLNDLLAGVSIDDHGDRVYSAPNLIAFMQGVLREQEPLTVDEATESGHDVSNPDEDGWVWIATDDVRVFNRIVYGKKHIVPIDELGEMAMWIAERLANRPTLPSARYGRGRS